MTEMLPQAPRPRRTNWQARWLQGTLMRFATHSKALHFVLAALSLAAMFGLAMGASLNSSPTFDEGFYIARGWAFLKTGSIVGTEGDASKALGHPPLTNLISGLGVLLEPELPQPTSLAGWDENNPEQFSESLLWQSKINTNRVVFLARLPILFLAMLLGALVYRWGRELYGRWSAWLALTLYAFCPNILAHAGLATTDLGVAAFFLATLYAWMRFLRTEMRRWLLVSGICFGLAQASKFSALVLIPILALMTVWHVWRRGAIRIPLRRRCIVQPRLEPKRAGGVQRLASAAAALTVMGLIGIVALWAAYLFRITPYPLAQYVAEFQHFVGLAAGGHRAYLLGRISETGWWYYHPFTLAAKLTLPTLILLAIALTLAIGREMHPQEWAVIFPLLAYLGFTMVGSLNVGIRYLLPIIPLLFLFIARIAYGPVRSGLVRPSALSLFVAGHALIAFIRFPYYIPFFNLAVGGPENGPNLLADSNLDWGQDLPALANYLDERGINTPIYLSYFGQSDPAYYGIDYMPLPAWPPPPPDPDRDEFTPMIPPSGLYAISASNLVGVQLFNPDTFGYFRARQPIERVGQSIYIYEVPPSDEAGDAQSWLAQCASPAPVEQERRLNEFTGIDLLHVTFNCTESLAFPAGAGWVLLAEGQEPIIDLGEPDYLARFPNGAPRYRVWHITDAPAAPASTVEFPPVELPIPIAGHLELIGYQLGGREPIRPGTSFTVTAWWRVREPPPPPVSIFAHMLRSDETALAVADALGIPAEQWQTGMVIVQQYKFNVPADAATGNYPIALGLYSLSTGERFLVSQSGDRVVDRIVITTVNVGR